MTYFRGMIQVGIVRGAGATGAAGATAPIAQTVHGATGCPFYRNYTSKFVRYSQKLEIIFKEHLSNLCLIFNHLQ
jgi:hypothetical protein